MAWFAGVCSVFGIRLISMFSMVALTKLILGFLYFGFFFFSLILGLFQLVLPSALPTHLCPLFVINSLHFLCSGPALPHCSVCVTSYVRFSQFLPTLPPQCFLCMYVSFFYFTRCSLSPAASLYRASLFAPICSIVVFILPVECKFHLDQQPHSL